MQGLLDLREAIEHLAGALEILDNLESFVAAAHVDSALQVLQQEVALRSVMPASLNFQLDYAHLEAMIDHVCNEAAVGVWHQAA